MRIAVKIVSNAMYGVAGFTVVGICTGTEQPPTAEKKILIGLACTNKILLFWGNIGLGIKRGLGLLF